MFVTNTKILIVDDMMTMRKIVRKALKNLGYDDITEMKNGNEAWNELQQGGYQLVISDWNMPVCSGIELLEKVRNSEYQEIPFVLLTAESETHQVQEALQKGVDNYIVKPFSPGTLKDKLEQTFNKVKGRIAA